jgi:hypothetical protein
MCNLVLDVAKRAAIVGVAVTIGWSPSRLFAQTNSGGPSPNLTPAGGQADVTRSGVQRNAADSQVIGSPNYDYLDGLEDQRNSGGPNPPSSLPGSRGGSDDQRNSGGPSTPGSNSTWYVPRSIFGDQRNQGGPNPPRGESNLVVPRRIFARQLNSNGSNAPRSASTFSIPLNLSGATGLNNQNNSRRERHGADRLNRQDGQRASWGHRPPNVSWARGTQGASSQPTRSRFAEIRAERRGGPDGYGGSQDGSSASTNE